MKLAINHLKLNSDRTIAMFDKAYNNINVYFKSQTGKPVRKETSRGDGWTILNIIAKDNNIALNDLVDDFSPSVFAEKVTFRWH